MLLQFCASNYKSFKDEFVFSMIPAKRLTGLDYSILTEEIGKEKQNIKALCSAIIYGPNASGKTNIIGAMDTFKSIIKAGHIRNLELHNPNYASAHLELIPNISEKKPVPVNFSIKFTVKKMLIEYFISIDLGCFMDSSYDRKILSEKLIINNQNIFSREQQNLLINLEPIKSYLSDNFFNNSTLAHEIALKNLSQSEFFLTNGFKVIYSSELSDIITDWINNHFYVYYRADLLKLTPNLMNKSSNSHSLFVEKSLNDAAKCFGINSNAIGYAFNKDTGTAQLCSLFGTEETGKFIPAESFESFGTIRFINIFPLVVNSLLSGSTLVIDEFDASIHPMALMNIINIFHDDQINVNHAQLIFNTHNPVFLNNNLFRRDEIKFVERDDNTHFSSLYSLADFGTSGEAGVRKTENYMKNYFVDRYGAIRTIDFSPLIKELINESTKRKMEHSNTDEQEKKN